MKLTDIGTPKELYNSPCSPKAYFFLIPDEEHYDILADHLEKVGGWDLEGRRRVIEAQGSIYMCSYANGNVDWMRGDKNGYDYFISVGYSYLEIEWDGQISTPILSASFCSCSLPVIVKSHSGFGGGGGETFDYCRACKKERE